MRKTYLMGILAAALLAQSGAALAQGSDLLRLESYAGEPLVPRLNNTLLMSAGSEENERLKQFLLQAPANPSELSGKRIAAVSTDGVEEIELTGIVNSLRARGAA